MNDEHIKTTVMDTPPGADKPQQPAAAVAEKLQTSLNDLDESSSEVDFTQTYSYLT